MVTISVVVATIPPRAKERAAIREQLEAQTRQPGEVILWTDEVGAGAALSRNIGLAHATSEFVAFFDDDDVMYPRHLELLERTQQRTGADLVYPWHDILPAAPNPLAVGGKNPYQRPFDLAARRQILDGKNFIPIAVLVRRELMEFIGGFHNFDLTEWDPSRCEILDAWQKLLRAGASFAHCPHKTWAAVRNGENTAGLDWREHVGTKQRWYDDKGDNK